MSDATYSGPINQWLAQAPPAPPPQQSWGKSLASLLAPYLRDSDQAQAAAEAAAGRVRAPYAAANERTSGLPEVAGYFGNRLASALTAPRDAFTGAMQVNDPATGMPTPEAMQRGQAVANMAMTGGMPFAARGAAGMAGGKLVQPETVRSPAVVVGGKIYTGPTHLDAYNQALTEHGGVDPGGSRRNQFMTTNGRLIGHQEAIDLSRAQLGLDLPPEAGTAGGKLVPSKDSNPVPVQFRDIKLNTPSGKTDTTGVWFVHGDKPTYASSNLEGARGILGDTAEELNKFPSVTGKNANGNPITVWHKPGEEGRAQAAVDNFKSAPVGGTVSDQIKYHLANADAYGYPRQAAENYVRGRFGDKEVDKVIGDRISFQSSGATKGTAPAGKAAERAQETPEQAAARKVEMKAAYDAEMAAAEKKFGKPKGLSDLPGGEAGRVGFKSLGDPLQTRATQRTPQGRPMHTEPLGIGKENAILQAGERRMTRIVGSRPEQEKLLRDAWEKRGPDLDYEDFWAAPLGDRIWRKEVSGWNETHGTTLDPDNMSMHPDHPFIKYFDEKYLAGKKSPFPGVKQANEYFEQSSDPSWAAYRSKPPNGG